MQEEKEKAIKDTIAMWKEQKEGVTVTTNLLRQGHFPGKVCELHSHAIRFLDFLNNIADAQIRILKKELADGKKVIVDTSETNIVVP